MNQLFTKRKSCFTFSCSGIPLLHDLDRGTWLPQGGTGHWIFRVDIGYSPDLRNGLLDIEYLAVLPSTWTLDIPCWLLDIEYWAVLPSTWTLDIPCWLLDIEYLAVLPSTWTLDILPQGGIPQGGTGYWILSIFRGKKGFLCAPAPAGCLCG